MAKGLIGKKIGMTQVFLPDGKVIPVTVIRVGPCHVSQIRTDEKDGYSSVQLAFETVKESKLSKAEVKHLAKSSIPAKRYLKEFRNFGESLEAGSELNVADVFAESDAIKISGIGKGKGFQGVMKRHGFAGGPETHGSRNHRAPGSIGACATPSRVFKGVRLPGRMGGKKVTVRNLKVVQVRKEDNLLMVSGSVPGPDNSIVTIEKI